MSGSSIEYWMYLRFPPVFHGEAQVQDWCLVYKCAREEKETDKLNETITLGRISASLLQLTSILSGMLWSIIFSLQMADHRTKVKVMPPLCNHQAPKTQYHTNVNQMWVFYSSSTTTGLLFSGNDLVNGAFGGVSAPEKGFKMVRKLELLHKENTHGWILEYKGDIHVNNVFLHLFLDF